MSGFARQIPSFLNRKLKAEANHGKLHDTQFNPYVWPHLSTLLNQRRQLHSNLHPNTITIRSDFLYNRLEMILYAILNRNTTSQDFLSYFRLQRSFFHFFRCMLIWSFTDIEYWKRFVISHVFDFKRKQFQLCICRLRAVERKQTEKAVGAWSIEDLMYWRTYRYILPLFELLETTWHGLRLSSIVYIYVDDVLN